MISHPLVATAVYAGGFFLELFALVGMRSRAWAAFFGVALVLMHRGIYLIMNLKFVYHELLMLIFLVNVPFWIVKSGRALKGQKI